MSQVPQLVETGLIVQYMDPSLSQVPWLLFFSRALRFSSFLLDFSLHSVAFITCKSSEIACLLHFHCFRGRGSSLRSLLCYS